MTIMVTIAAIAALFFLVYSLVLIVGRIRRDQRVFCQEKQRTFDVTFQHYPTLRIDAGEKADVTRCTAFANPEEVNCDKQCLHWSEETTEQRVA